MEKATRCCGSLWTAFSRTKSLDINRLQETELKRCLSVIDLTALGVGSTLGAGIYVLTGQVAKTQAGPAIIISFLIAAFASFLAGLCYAEFAARVPKAGSAYIYSYVSVGELWAFVIGWNMILENMIGAASSGKAWSQFLDSLFNDTIRRTMEAHVGLVDVPLLDSYPDFLAMGLLILATLLVSFGVKFSSNINLVFTVINLVVIICIIGVGFVYADLNNWTPADKFFPYKFRGVIAGAATCFYAFVGFDTIASSGEESTKPTTHVPIAIITTLVICLIAYLGVSSVLTLIVPYYALAETAALPKAFAQNGIPGAEYVIAVGGLCGLTASMMGSIWPLPRGVYAMAQDGLVFRWLGNVNKFTDTPLIATWISGALVALSALLFDLNALIEMMSIGTLMAYTLVAVSVLVLHYQREQVGLTAADVQSQMTPSDPKRPGRSTSSNGIISSGEAGLSGSSEGISLSEDTGLLRVGDGSNRIRYVPTKTTTVVRRIKPHTDSDEEGPPPDQPDPITPPPVPTPQSPPMASGSKQGQHTTQHASVVDEYRSKVQQQQLARAAAAAAAAFDGASSQTGRVSESELGAPVAGSTYQRIDSNHSISNLSQLFNAGSEGAVEPTGRTRKAVVWALVLLIIVWTSLCLLTIYGERNLANADWWAITLICFMVAAILTLVIVIVKQPRNDAKLNFNAPLVPLLPLASVMINIYLMITLSPDTWIRFAVWMGAGFLIYFGYGIWHSSERRADDHEVILYDVTDKNSLIVDGVYR